MLQQLGARSMAFSKSVLFILINNIFSSTTYSSVDKMTDVEIVKIPLSDEEKIQPTSKFKRMPILYLELIENKLKIKPELVNKPYEQPKRDLTTTSEKPVEDVPADPAEEAPPTLEELQAKNPDESILKKEYKFPKTDDEATIDKRNKVFFHYQVLKRMHPNAPIPEFNAYSDPDAMSQKYEIIAKKLALDSSVENWKRYMIIFVMGLEVVLGKMAFDVEGFAQQQLVQMHTYDSLLVEMAEKSYTPKGTSRWPVEVRLMMMLTVNMALFIVCRMIEKRTGSNLLGTINQMTGTGAEKLMKSPPST